MQIKNLLLTVLSLLYFTCGLSSQKKIIQGEEILVGKIDRQQLFFDYPDWMASYNDYQVEDSLLQLIKGGNRVSRVEIYMGTWCGDSRREVPRFFKIVDSGGFQFEPIEMWALDRSKIEETGMTEKRNISRVATFVFFEGENEIGRIVERPHVSLEQDILEIIQQE